MKPFLVIILCLFYLSNGYSQQVQDTFHVVELEEAYVNRRQQIIYQNELHRLQRVYPLAVKAKAILDEYEATLSSFEKKKEAKRYSQKMNAYLNDEFSYAIRDLYVSEGRLLIQLIHRETGMTVKQIMSKYSNGFQNMIYSTAAKVMKHDLNDTYNPQTKNKWTEMVIEDILAGNVGFEMKMDKLTRDKFKESQQNYRKQKKEMREYNRDSKKENRLEKKEAKRKK